MLSDEIIKDSIDRGFVEVDHKLGIVKVKRFKNKIASCINKGGYIVFTINHPNRRIQAKAHRVMWISAYGIPCPSILDHINGIKTDNRLSNIRPATAKLNSNNRRSYNGSNNPSAKINEIISESIRLDYNKLASYSKVATKYNVSKTTVANIVKQKSWA